MSAASAPGAVPHLIIGTKAQFIKMAPIATLLERQGRPYRILDLSQHGSLTGQILQDFELQPDLVYFLPTGRTVGTYAQMLRWLARAGTELARPARRLRQRLVLGSPAVALVHGDTFSTALGLYLARRLGLPVGLVEAGLSSGQLLNPFPEEMVRRHVEKRAQFLFPPDDVSTRRLEERKLRGAIHPTGYNTGRDALLLMARRAGEDGGSAPTPSTPRTVLTLHRAETLGRSGRLRRLVEHLQALAPELAPVTFYLHEPTERALTRTGLRRQLEDDPHITLQPLAAYPDFVRALVHASFVLTDGGSVQEETSYLGKPCLVLRQTTERPHGIGTSAALTTFDPATDLAFLRSVAESTDQPATDEPTFAAPRVILDALDAHVAAAGGAS
ncbi:MAG: UDP-N-acetylglucosamine 2-epimerase [Acidobacteriota bacterium]|nr:UDP-N-acetylglucosamine 2-epimerase [Acidobacteriota bacterium]